jgi:two-component system OmpR family sensor kinase
MTPVPRSLYWKLALVLLGLFLLVGTTFVIVSVYSNDMYQQEVAQKLNYALAKLIVSERIVMRDNHINEDALREIFHMLMVVNPSIEVYLVDPEGSILAFSAEPGKVKRKRIDLEPVREFLSGKAVFPLRGDDPRDLSGKKVFTAARIPQTGRLEGYLYVILGGEVYDSVMQRLQRSYIFRLSIWTMAASLSVAAIGGLIIFAFLTRRLKRLASAIGQYKAGAAVSQLDLPAVGGGGREDEIDRLILAFREMAGRIEEQVDSLKAGDAMRRELVANISHDLRTPLAALQGYVETLSIKNSILSPGERMHYLDVAMRHCTRINTLVSDLFELAKLDARETVPQREPFSAGELVQDVVQKFQLAAQSKDVAIKTNAGGDLPFVFADIALIERVFENLLDNALRHTPPGGTISVSLTADGEDVIVAVADTGSGIPAAELPHIFERFYQLDKSREGRSRHSGLGLAISKRIMQLHGRTLEVRSAENEGTTFSFALPVYRPGV